VHSKMQRKLHRFHHYASLYVAEKVAPSTSVVQSFRPSSQETASKFHSLTYANLNKQKIALRNGLKNKSSERVAKEERRIGAILSPPLR
jgi:hypothetical protein